MSWLDTLKTVAPTVATALGGPLAGAAVAALGDVLGVSEPTQEKIAKAFTNGQLTGEQILAMKDLELKYQNEEKERGFRYAELSFKDRESARNMAIQTHSYTPSILTWIIVTITLLAEGALMFRATPPGVDPVILGRVLGTLDSALILVLSFWFGSTSASAHKTEVISDRRSTPR